MTDHRKPTQRGGGKPGAPTRGRGPRDFAVGAGAPTRHPRPGASLQLSARDRVHRLLSTQVKAFPDLEIAQLDTVGLDARDAALAHAIYDTVLRRWNTLVYLIQGCLNTPWAEMNPRVAAPLMAGAAQLVFMDRIPAHAAVDEAVEAAKTAGNRSGGLVNAVLRTLISEIGAKSAGEMGLALPRRERWNGERDELPLADGGALVLAKPILPKDALELLSITTSHPIELLRAWSKTMPAREVRRIALHGLVSPPVILNTAFATAPLPLAAVGPATSAPAPTSGSPIAKTIMAPGVDLPTGLTPHTAPGHHVWNGPHDELSALLKSRRDIWAQDPASSLAVSSVADLKPNVVIDMCAGMGTKTRQLAATFPNAQIVTTDVDLPRHRTLQDVFRGQAQVTVVPYNKLVDYAGKADLVLLDVPCSNTGVLARRVEARYRFDRARSEKLAAMQKQIIADSIPLLKQDASGRGKLLYSTCSLDPMENEQQGRWAAQWHLFKVSREHRRLPEGGPGEPAEKYTDGSYAVLLE